MRLVLIPFFLLSFTIATLAIPIDDQASAIKERRFKDCGITHPATCPVGAYRDVRFLVPQDAFRSLPLEMPFTGATGCILPS